MKKALLSLLLLVWTAVALAQYPHVTVKQIQQVPADSLAMADTITNYQANSTQPEWTLQTSPYMNDTVVVTGIVAVPPMVITYTSSGWTMVLYDTAATQDAWAGILVRANIADSTQLIADGFMSVSAGDTITMTGLVSEFPTQRGFSLTQLQPIAGHPIDVSATTGPVPKIVVKNVGDFYKGIFSTGKMEVASGEPYEGMYVEFHNLVIDNKVNTARGTFSAVDSAGNEISEYDMSRYFTLGQTGWTYADTAWVTKYANIGNGTRIDTLRGIITTSSGSEGPRGYRIAPLYYRDIVFTTNPTPPLVTSHRRNPVLVTPDTTATISVKVTQQVNGSLPKTVSLKYSLNNAAFVTLAMSYHAADTTWIGVIPKQPDLMFVRYYIEVADSFGQIVRLANSATSGIASDTSKGFFFYNVKTTPLTIHDVQYTPYINGRSPYLGAVTALTGIITADTAHIGISPYTTGSTNAWYMQSRDTSWGGIWLSTSDTLVQKQLGALRNGDSVAVTGTVQEQFDVTRLGSITSVVKYTGGNRVPAAITRATGTLNVGNGAASAEPYEGMLVRFNNVTVTDVNPTFSDPSEYSVNDGSGPVVVQHSGENRYSNVPADTLLGKTILRVGNKIGALTGIVYYSFNQYKFVPRTDSDFVNVTLTGVAMSQQSLPQRYTVSQNFPNPFNPSTTIQFALPRSGHVTLKVYNLLGQEVSTLVDDVREAGNYTVRFDASRLASGVYFYRLQSGSFSVVKKMALLK